MWEYIIRINNLYIQEHMHFALIYIERNLLASKSNCFWYHQRSLDWHQREELGISGIDSFIKLLKLIFINEKADLQNRNKNFRLGWEKWFIIKSLLGPERPSVQASDIWWRSAICETTWSTFVIRHCRSPIWKRAYQFEFAVAFKREQSRDRNYHTCRHSANC